VHLFASFSLPRRRVAHDVVYIYGLPLISRSHDRPTARCTSWVGGATTLKEDLFSSSEGKLDKYMDNVDNVADVFHRRRKAAAILTSIYLRPVGSSFIGQTRIRWAPPA
jgi:hypothetical protein